MIDLTFNLEKDLVFFDIESTGLNVLKDRILQIALIKYSKNTSEPKELFMLINPGVPNLLSTKSGRKYLILLVMRILLDIIQIALMYLC